MTKITDSGTLAHGWWFNPSTAATTDLGTFANSGTHNFTPPDGNDWVLVLDANSAALPAPGNQDYFGNGTSIVHGAFLGGVH